MAVPTIISISPVSGFTKGRNLVKIEGTNFRLPDAPPATGETDGTLPLSVKVSFEGVDCEYAEAASATLIYCRAPQWVGDYKTVPVDLDIRVANIEASGAEIPGEAVVELGAYRVSRANLADESSLQKVIRELIRLFRRHLLENTHLSMSRDYDDIVTDFIRKKPELPVCYLLGPNTPVNRFSSCNRVDPEEGASPADWDMRAIPIVTDVVFDIVIVADSQNHIMSLNQAVLLLFRDVTEVIESGKEYELRMPFNRYPKMKTMPNMSDVFSLRASCLIKGVHVDDSDGTILESGWIISANDGEPSLDIQQK